MGHRSVYMTNKKTLRYSCLTDDIIHHVDQDYGYCNQQVHLKCAMAAC